MAYAGRKGHRSLILICATFTALGFMLRWGGLVAIYEHDDCNLQHILSHLGKHAAALLPVRLPNIRAVLCRKRARRETGFVINMRLVLQGPIHDLVTAHSQFARHKHLFTV